MNPQDPSTQPQQPETNPSPSVEPETAPLATEPAPQTSVEEPAVQPTTFDEQPASQPSVDTPTSFSETPAPVVAETAPKNNKILAIAIASIVALALLAAAAFALLNSANEPSETPAQEAPVTTTEESVETPTASPEEITLNKSIVDDELGYTITAETMSIDKFQIPAKYADANSDRTVVAVTYKNTDSNKFAGSANNVVLRLIDSTGKEVTATSLSDADLTAAGLTPLSEAKEANDTVQGTLVYWVNKDSTEKLTLKYKRPTSKVIGSDQTIPAKEFTVDLR